MSNAVAEQPHQFNCDLLIGENDRIRARKLFPLIAQVLIDDSLAERFGAIDARANNRKRHGRRAGLTAVLLAVASLIGLSISPLIKGAMPPIPTIVDLTAALLGVISFLVACLGVLRHSSKKRWLALRWCTERMRQFHFQFLIAHAVEIVEASKSQSSFDDLKKHYSAEMDKHFPLDDESFVREDVLENWKSALPLEPMANVWLISDESARPNAGDDALEQFFQAYLDLRLDHQISYSAHVLGKKRGPLRLTLDRRQHWIEIIALACVGALFLLHVAVVLGNLVGYPAWLVSMSHNPWTHVLTLWIAIVALGTRVLEDGHGIRSDVVRYSDYLCNLRVLRSRYVTEPTIDGKLAIMRRVEEIAFVEMTSFLRSAAKSKYLL
ncbi:MAG: hypothetical protein AAGG07_05770 [Planctomycetota bacterium]